MLAETTKEAALTVDPAAARLMAEIERVDSQLQDAVAVHNDLHRQLGDCIARVNELTEVWNRYFLKHESLTKTYQQTGDERVRREINAIVPEANVVVEKTKAERSTHSRLDPAHANAKARMLDLAQQKDSLLDELRARHSYLEVQKSTKKERAVQHRDKETKVNVGKGFDRQTGQYTTDVRIINRDPSVDTHRHIVITEDTGEVIYDEERSDKKK
jgi:hypothetical protein